MLGFFRGGWMNIVDTSNPPCVRALALFMMFVFVGAVLIAAGAIVIGALVWGDPTAIVLAAFGALYLFCYMIVKLTDWC